MHVLLADKFPAHGIAALEEIGCHVTSDPQLKDEALVRLTPASRARGAGGSLNAGHRTDAGDRLPGARRPCRCRLQHH